MTTTLSPTHQSTASPFAETIRRFTAEKVIPRNQELDQHPQDMGLIRELLLEAGRLGLYGAVIPEEYGGTGPNSLALHEGIEELGYGNAGLAMSLMPTYLLARAVALHGSADQKTRWLVPIAEGSSIGSWAVTEPHTGSDVASITTKAERTANGWRLNGRKMFITNATIADCLLILARTGGPGIRETLTTFVIPMDLPGISVPRAMEKMGLRSSPTCELVLDDVEVPDSDRLGPVGHGWQIGMDVLDYERLAIPAITAGMCTRALELSTKYAADRTAFGKPLDKHGPVQGMLADIACGVLECRLLYRHIAGLVDAERPAIIDGSIGKLVGARLANAVSSLAVQVHGGYGYIREYEVERLYRDARLFTIGGGTSEIQQKIIAEHVGQAPSWGRRAALP
jgi:alkylation response protein AidB-like acyl-CoA dehydrogenase